MNNNDLNSVIRQLQQQGLVPNQGLAAVAGQFGRVGGRGDPHGALETQKRMANTRSSLSEEFAELKRDVYDMFFNPNKRKKDAKEDKEITDQARKTMVRKSEMKMLTGLPSQLFANSPNPLLAVTVGIFQLLQVQVRRIIGIANTIGVESRLILTPQDPKKSFFRSLLSGIHEDLSKNLLYRTTSATIQHSVNLMRFFNIFSMTGSVMNASKNFKESMQRLWMGKEAYEYHKDPSKAAEKAGLNLKDSTKQVNLAKVQANLLKQIFQVNSNILEAIMHQNKMYGLETKLTKVDVAFDEYSGELMSKRQAEAAKMQRGLMLGKVLTDAGRKGFGAKLSMLGQVGSGIGRLVRGKGFAFSEGRNQANQLFKAFNGKSAKFDQDWKQVKLNEYEIVFLRMVFGNIEQVYDMCPDKEFRNFVDTVLSQFNGHSEILFAFEDDEPINRTLSWDKRKEIMVLFLKHISRMMYWGPDNYGNADNTVREHAKSELSKFINGLKNPAMDAANGEIQLHAATRRASKYITGKNFASVSGHMAQHHTRMAYGGNAENMAIHQGKAIAEHNQSYSDRNFGSKVYRATAGILATPLSMLPQGKTISKAGHKIADFFGTDIENAKLISELLGDFISNHGGSRIANSSFGQWIGKHGGNRISNLIGSTARGIGNFGSRLGQMTDSALNSRLLNTEDWSPLLMDASAGRQLEDSVRSQLEMSRNVQRGGAPAPGTTNRSEDQLREAITNQQVGNGQSPFGGLSGLSVLGQIAADISNTSLIQDISEYYKDVIDCGLAFYLCDFYHTAKDEKLILNMAATYSYLVENKVYTKLNDYLDMSLDIVKQEEKEEKSEKNAKWTKQVGRMARYINSSQVIYKLNKYLTTQIKEKESDEYKNERQTYTKLSDFLEQSITYDTMKHLGKMARYINSSQVIYKLEKYLTDQNKGNDNVTSAQERQQSIEDKLERRREREDKRNNQDKTTENVVTSQQDKEKKNSFIDALFDGPLGKILLGIGGGVILSNDATQSFFKEKALPFVQEKIIDPVFESISTYVKENPGTALLGGSALIALLFGRKVITSAIGSMFSAIGSFAANMVLTSMIGQKTTGLFKGFSNKIGGIMKSAPLRGFGPLIIGFGIYEAVSSVMEAWEDNKDENGKLKKMDFFGQLIVGKGEAGVDRAQSNATKWAGIGAATGNIIAPGVGAIVGGLLGGSVGFVVGMMDWSKFTECDWSGFNKPLLDWIEKNSGKDSFAFKWGKAGTESTVLGMGTGWFGGIVGSLAGGIVDLLLNWVPSIDKLGGWLRDAFGLPKIDMSAGHIKLLSSEERAEQQKRNEERIAKVKTENKDISQKSGLSEELIAQARREWQNIKLMRSSSNVKLLKDSDEEVTYDVSSSGNMTETRRKYTPEEIKKNNERYYNMVNQQRESMLQKYPGLTSQNLESFEYGGDDLSESNVSSSMNPSSAHGQIVEFAANMLEKGKGMIDSWADSIGKLFNGDTSFMDDPEYGGQKGDGSVFGRLSNFVSDKLNDPSFSGTLLNPGQSTSGYIGDRNNPKELINFEDGDQNGTGKLSGTKNRWQKNKNFGNVKGNKEQAQAHMGVDDQGHLKFASYSDGLIFWHDYMLRKYLNQGKNTLRQILPIYAPEYDEKGNKVNDHKTYIGVMRSNHFDWDTPITPDDETLSRLGKGMIQMETSHKFSPGEILNVWNNARKGGDQGVESSFMSQSGQQFSGLPMSVVGGGSINSRSGIPKIETEDSHGNKTGKYAYSHKYGKAMMSMLGLSSNDKLAWPAKSNIITSPYGPRNVTGGSKWHAAIDIAGTRSDPAFAIMGGTVETADINNPYHTVRIKHPNGLTSEYLHMDKIGVSKGQHVNAGDQIGMIGGYGKGKKGEPFKYAFPTHLHLGLKMPDGTAIDPEALFAKNFGEKYKTTYSGVSDSKRHFFSTARQIGGPGDEPNLGSRGYSFNANLSSYMNEKNNSGDEDENSRQTIVIKEKPVVVQQPSAPVVGAKDNGQGGTITSTGHGVVDELISTLFKTASDRFVNAIMDTTHVASTC